MGTYELLSKPSLHLCIVTIIGDRFLGECPITLQCFVHISDKHVSAKLQWSSTNLTIIHIGKHGKFMRNHGEIMKNMGTHRKIWENHGKI